MAEKLGYEWERMIIGMRKIRLPFVCGNHGKVDGGRVEDELYARQWDFVPGVEMLRCTAVGLLFYIPQFITLRYVEVASHNLFKTRGLLSALFHLYFVQFDCYLYCPNYAETLSFLFEILGTFFLLKMISSRTPRQSAKVSIFGNLGLSFWQSFFATFEP